MWLYRTRFSVDYVFFYLFSIIKTFLGTSSYLIIQLKLCKTLKMLSKHHILTVKEDWFFHLLFFNSAICCLLDLVRQKGCKTNICWSKDQKLAIFSALNVFSIASHANHSAVVIYTLFLQRWKSYSHSIPLCICEIEGMKYKSGWKLMDLFSVILESVLVI